MTRAKQMARLAGQLRNRFLIKLVNDSRVYVECFFKSHVLLASTLSSIDLHPLMSGDKEYLFHRAQTLKQRYMIEST